MVDILSFGDACAELFGASVSQGVLSNLTEHGGRLFALTDLPCVGGCEGGAVLSTNDRASSG